LTLAAGACGGGGHGSGPADPGPDAPPPTLNPISNTAAVPAPTSLTCPKGTSLTYENFGEAFMLAYCTACHSAHLAGSDRNGAPDGQDFDTANAVKVWRAAILADTAGATPKMPPADNVSPADAASLSEWLNCGAPSVGNRSRLP
jgi:hypothetical protein